MREPGEVARGAAKERGTTPSQPEKADVTYRRDSCEGQTTAGKRKFRANTTLVLPLGDHTRKGTTEAESKSGPSMDTIKKTPAVGRVQGEGTHHPQPDKPAKGAILETNTAAKRPKLATGFCPVEP